MNPGVIELTRGGGLWVDLDLAGETADGLELLARHLGDRTVRGEWDARLPSAGVLDERLVAAQIEAGDDRSGTIGCRQDVGLPAARGEAECGVLQLPLDGSQHDSELPEDLRVCMERVARLAPGVV